jgi:hypothetical protein
VELSYPHLEASSERADDELVESRAPWYVRLVGWILAAFGGVNVAALAWAMPALFALGRPDVLIAVLVVGVVPLVGGIGTIASRRWGWVVSFVAVTVAILFGIAAWAFEGVASVVSPTAEGLDFEWTWLTFLVLPGLAMLGALLAPATIRWLRAPARAA